jgi:hypothetical protein
MHRIGAGADRERFQLGAIERGLAVFDGATQCLQYRLLPTAKTAKLDLDLVVPLAHPHLHDRLRRALSARNVTVRCSCTSGNPLNGGLRHSRAEFRTDGKQKTAAP